MATLGSIDHVGIAVSDLDTAVAVYTRLCGREPIHRSRVDADGVEAVLFETGAQRIELLGATRADSSISRFLDRRGGGLHHVAYAVPDVQAALDHYSSMGLRLIDRAPRPGAGGRLVGFLHPEAAGGVLVELCQPAPGPAPA
jgi:methylmalonyl-CoA/ethylmalonyl-CoA epimerase